MEALAKLGWHVQPTWLDEQGSPLPPIDKLTTLLLDEDLEDVGKAALPETKPFTMLPTPIVLQVTKVVNVSAPSDNQQSSAFPRLLRVSLTDGTHSLMALEMEPCPQISMNTPPGTKLLFSSSNQRMRNGFLMLFAGSFKCLGGKVSVLLERWTMLKDLASRSRRAGTEGGPPVFEPYQVKGPSTSSFSDGNGKELTKTSKAQAHPTKISRKNDDKVPDPSADKSAGVKKDYQVVPLLPSSSSSSSNNRDSSVRNAPPPPRSTTDSFSTHRGKKPSRNEGPTPSDTPASEPHGFAIGQACEAVYKADGNFYPCTIEKIFDSQSFLVKFDGYNDKQRTKLADLRKPSASTTTTTTITPSSSSSSHPVRLTSTLSSDTVVLKGSNPGKPSKHEKRGRPQHETREYQSAFLPQPSLDTVVQDPAPRFGTSKAKPPPSTSESSPAGLIGKKCIALCNADGQLYPAVVENVVDDKFAIVAFDRSKDIQIVLISELQFQKEEEGADSFRQESTSRPRTFSTPKTEPSDSSRGHRTSFRDESDPLRPGRGNPRGDRRPRGQNSDVPSNSSQQSYSSKFAVESTPAAPLPESKPPGQIDELSFPSLSGLPGGTSGKLTEYKVGLKVQAKYYGDNQYYAAVVQGVFDDENVLILFTDYNEDQVTHVRDLRTKPKEGVWSSGSSSSPDKPLVADPLHSDDQTPFHAPITAVPPRNSSSSVPSGSRTQQQQQQNRRLERELYVPRPGRSK